MRILWLHEANFSGKQRGLLELYLRKSKIDPADIFFVSIHTKIDKLWIRKPKTKNTWICNPEKEGVFHSTLEYYIKMTKCDLIVINDNASLGFMTGYTSLDLCRGSVYRYNDIPCPVVDRITKVHVVKHAPWVLLQDLGKIKRWVTKKKKHEPKFNYNVIHNIDTIPACLQFLDKCFVISTDIETVADFITCIGFTGLHVDGSIWTYIFPFYNPLKPGNCHWGSIEDEVIAWTAVKTICASPALKVLQNGSYDAAYFIKYNIILHNYIGDTLHLFHSIWCESPKKLNFITSLLVDNCRYWKDENKGDKDERIPSTPDGVERYWRYNGLDCHNTLLCFIFLVSYITKETMAWALKNYNTEFSLQVGPALAMSMRGAFTNEKRQGSKTIAWLREHTKSLKILRTMVDDPEFNPNSNDQVASLIYDVLGASKIKMKGKKKLGERTVDEKVLRLIRIQHPLFAKYIDAIWNTKKPLNNCSKYGRPSINKSGKPIGLKLLNNRLMYCYSSAGTETGRFNGKYHQYWIGTNPMNVPDKDVRDMVQADEGYVFFEPDYSQSDNYFVAFECEDPDMMRNVTDDRDTHAVHAEFFFKEPYQKVFDAHQASTDWADHPVTGIRQNTKRIVHGSNYRMAGFTLYVTMGHEAVVSCAKTLGFNDAHLWSRKQLVDICSRLLMSYHKLYKGLPEWFENSVKEAVKNGNRATCAFGRTRLFFGDLAHDEAIQRELSAYFGQGGTAGNINDTLIKLYYESDLESQGLMLMMQTHDSILTQIPEQKLGLGEKFLTIMEKECTIKERSFTVPVGAKIGYSWGRRGMINWHPGIGLGEIKAHEERLNASYS